MPGAVAAPHFSGCVPFLPLGPKVADAAAGLSFVTLRAVELLSFPMRTGREEPRRIDVSMKEGPGRTCD